jgi:cytochrome c oxidase subunit 4
MTHDVTPQDASPGPAALRGVEADAPNIHDLHSDHEREHLHHPHVNYLAIFIALCVCTALSVVFDLVPMNHKLVVVLVLAVAVAKAQYVMRYFMHLKFEGLWKYVLLLPTAILACGLPLALAPDIALHYYTPEYAAMGEEPEAPGRSEHGHAPIPGEQDPKSHTPSH